MNSAKSRIRELWVSIIALPSNNRTDIKKMVLNCERILDEISKEEVLCRQRKHLTSKYKNLVQELDVALSETEKYLVFAGLIS